MNKVTLTTKHVSALLSALGVDAVTGDYSYDESTHSIRVEGFTDTDILAAEQSLDAAALDAQEALDNVHTTRASQYPNIGDQLDAVWKQLKYMEAQGITTLTPEAKDMLITIDTVKAANPKNV